jgi:hypothetical protein
VNRRVKKFLDELLIKYVNPVYKAENEVMEDTANTEVKQGEDSELLRKSKTSVIAHEDNENTVGLKRSGTETLEKFDDEKVEGIIVEESKEVELVNMINELKVEQKPSEILFNGYTPETDLQRILMVTHGGVIMELNNIIYKFKGIEKFAKNESSNTGLTVIRIYCASCGGVCKGQQNCKLEFDYILNNDVRHCKHIDEIKK